MDGSQSEGLVEDDFVAGESASAAFGSGFEDEPSAAQELDGFAAVAAVDGFDFAVEVGGGPMSWSCRGRLLARCGTRARTRRRGVAR